VFSTDHYHSRFFNTVVADGRFVIKSSNNIEKIKSEYQFYYYLPENLKNYFVKPFSLEITEGVASYRMVKVPVLNAAQTLISGSMRAEEFQRLLDQIFDFISTCTASDKTVDEVKLESWNLVVVKAFTRLRDMPEHSQALYRLTKAYQDISKERTKWVSRMSHGDLCLSNVLWMPNTNNFVLVDPRGASLPADIYMDEYYDLAKLQHSIKSGYEVMLYEFGEVPAYALEVFNHKIERLGVNKNLLKVYEAGLFLSMIPLHAENKVRMRRFAKKADEILSTLGY
jgi:hypothetical protein